jgi:small subunit ribosomal protein S17
VKLDSMDEIKIEQPGTTADSPVPVEQNVVPAEISAPAAPAVQPASPVQVSDAVDTPSSDRTRRKTRVGAVISAKMEKSIIVVIERRVAHPLYKKYFKKTTRLMAHDEKRQAKPGDIVKIMETRPLSKRKCWRLVEIVESAK